MHVGLTACRAEATDSETAPVCADGDKLRTAAGILNGMLLSSVLWVGIGLLVWRLIG